MEDVAQCPHTVNIMVKLNRKKKTVNLSLFNFIVIKQSIDKELRLRYFDVCVEFYKKLKEMCEKLKEFPRDGQNGRNNILKTFIFSFNNLLKDNREDCIQDDERRYNVV